MTAYTASNAVPMTALPTTNGVVQEFVASTTNTGSATYAPDGLASAPIFGQGGQPLEGSEIVAEGIVTLESYIGPLRNSGALCWVLVDCVGGTLQVAPATEAAHAVQLQQLAFQNRDIYVLIDGVQNVSVNGAAFTSTGAATFTVPATGIFKAIVQAGGGGSGGSNGQGSASLGGGGGGCFEGLVSNQTPGTQFTIQVGAGGTAGAGGTSPTDGGNGGNSSVGSLITATGGTGGVAANNTVASGSSPGGDVSATISGLEFNGGRSSGVMSLGNGIVVSSAGGMSHMGAWQNWGSSAATEPGEPGNEYGGGAAGSLIGGVGAAGGNGCVVIDY